MCLCSTHIVRALSTMRAEGEHHACGCLAPDMRMVSTMHDLTRLQIETIQILIILYSEQYYVT